MNVQCQAVTSLRAGLQLCVYADACSAETFLNHEILHAPQ